MCGINSHRHLDAVMCKCHRCNKQFYGYNKESMAKDADVVLGIFNFYLAKGFAIDDEAHSFIIYHSHDTTASMHRRLALSVTDKCLQDALCCYRAVREKKVSNTLVTVCESDKTQRTIDSLINFTAASNLVESRQITMLTQLRASQRELATAQSAFDGDIQFIQVFWKKSNRNNFDLPFKGIGRKKLLMLIDRNVTSAKELLHCDGVDPVVKSSWKHVVQKCYDDLEESISWLKVVRLQI